MSSWDLKNLSSKSGAQKQWLNMVLDVHLMALTILNLDLFFHISWIHYKLESIITKFVENINLM